MKKVNINKKKHIILAPIALALSFLSPTLVAEPVAGFQTAVREAVLSSPLVNARWYDFEAAREAQRSAFGSYLPSVDVIADIGEEDRETPFIDTGSFSRDTSRLTITQMLFDGFATRNAVAQLGYEKLSAYYELMRASEEIGLEAIDAYLDTMKFQRLVQAAEQNYVYHRQIYDKISERTIGGVSQGVDLEQAASRVALSESNLLTSMTNLHDVRTRFQRLVGALPADNLVPPVIPSGMIPQLREAALNQAYAQSPTINAAIENLRAAQSALNSTNAPMMPSLDLRYRNERSHDLDDNDGTYDEEAIELVLEYNLFRGGADSARKRQFYNLYNSAIEQRKQACLNVRQEVMIAFNDIKALEEQLIYLGRSQTASDRTRRAYRDQFDLGQRSLLDLLDSQNEYFDTQRAYILAQAKLLSSQATTLANMGVLLSALNIKGLNSDKIAELDLNLERGEDENGQPLCPREAPTEVVIDKSALFAPLVAAAPTRYRDVGDGKVSIDLMITFALESAVITSNFDDEIANAARFLKQNPETRGVVEGHTDTTGTAAYNMDLSNRRADAVRNMLINEYNVNPNQLSSVGYGMERPRFSNATRPGREKNRRVELVLDAAAADF